MKKFYICFCVLFFALKNSTVLDAQQIIAALDNTFSNDGKFLVPIPGMSSAAGIALDNTTHKIAGVATTPAGVATFLVNADGTLDNNFSNDGYDLVTSISGLTAADVCFFDGKILVLAYIPGTNVNLRLISYNLDGTLNTSFAAGGIKTPNTTNFMGKITPKHMAIDGSKIYIAGYSCRYTPACTGQNVENGIVIRLLSTGDMDNTFNTNGHVESNISAYPTYINDIAVTGSNILVFCGNYVTGTETLGYVESILTNGNANVDFYGGSLNTIDLGAYTTANKIMYNTNYSPGSLAQNLYMVAGTTHNGGDKSTFVASFTGQGYYSSGFSSGSPLVLTFGGYDFYGTSIGLLSDGRFATGGYVGTGSDNDFVTTVINTDGTPYSAFSSDGAFDFDFSNSNDKSDWLQIQNGAKMILGGSYQLGGTTNYALARVTYMDVPNSLTESSTNPGLKVYPSPLKQGNIAKILFTSEINREAEVNIFDVKGAQIASGSLITAIPELLSTLTTGIYFVQITSNQYSATHKIIITP